MAMSMATFPLLTGVEGVQNLLLPSAPGAALLGFSVLTEVLFFPHMASCMVCAVACCTCAKLSALLTPPACCDWWECVAQMACANCRAACAGMRMLEKYGVQAQELRVVGGGSKNPLWRRVIADAFQVQLPGRRLCLALLTVLLLRCSVTLGPCAP